MKLTHRIFLAQIALGAVLLLPAKGKSENPPPGGNPFGAAQPQPSTPTPPQGADEDDFLDPGNSFGFQQQKNGAQPNLPNPNIPTPNTPPNPGMAAQNSPPTKPFVRPSVAGAAVSPSALKASDTTKAAPKLSEYLELDSAVKGLEVKNFDLPDKEIKDVVTLISKWTGKNFILDSKVRGKITIIGPSQVTLQEAYQAFLSALDANNLTTVQSGKFIRIIESAEARRSPVKTYAGDYAPKDDQFITRIFQLKFINADEVQREFRDLTTRQGKLFAYEPTNSLIITDTGSNIQRIKEILETLDVKSFETTLHVMRIKNTSAKAISEMLGAIYGDDGGKPGQPRSFRKSALERTRGGGVITKIIPDEATNSLVVLANVGGFEQLRELVAKLDVKVTDTGHIHVYYCEYAKAEDLSSTLAALSGAGGAKSPKRTTGATGGIGNTGNTGGSAGPVTAELEGGVKITADAATNALVITANASDYQTLKKVIKKLDIPRLQVFIESAILEVSMDTNTKIGIDVASSAPGRLFTGGFIGDSATLLQTLSGTGVPGGATIPFFAGQTYNQGQLPLGANGTNINVTTSTIMGLLNLLTTTTNSTVLQTPQIIALDNEKAEFQVLDEIPVTGSTTIATPTSGAVQNVDRLKAGVTLKLTPHVNAASRQIRLEIEQQVDSFSNSSLIPTELASKNKATTSRKTNTTVVVKDQDYIMMGGLISDKIIDTITKVPLLGDIPILGWLFKSKNYQATKSNLAILLHPKIIGTTMAAADLAKDRLGKRKKFIEDNFGGDDEVEKEVDEIDKEIDSQLERGKNEPVFDYRNNNDDDSDVKKPEAKADPQMGKPEKTPLLQSPQTETPAAATQPNAGANPPPDAPLLAPPTDGGGQ